MTAAAAAAGTRSCSTRDKCSPTAWTLLLLLLALLICLLSEASARSSAPPAVNSLQVTPKVEGSIITAPRRTRPAGCKRGQLLDRRGKCRTPYRR